MKTALVQLSVSDDPAANLPITLAHIENAASQGAAFVLLPEVANCISTSRRHQQEVLQSEEDDITLAALRGAAANHSIWLLIGSLALKTEDPDGRFANRSFLIDPEGQIAARYDKIHMFDVQINETETFRESSSYRPGTQAVVAKTPFANIGMSVCYDVRFPELYQKLVGAGAQIITVPAAFSPVTGAAHWHSLLRARAIETGCYVLAPAQTGEHASALHKTRHTYGHALAVSPWGEVLIDAECEEGIYMFDLDMEHVSNARAKVPSLKHKREFKGP
ncbi:amidohydrolase [Sulfitobacter sp. SK012]|uniref:carbon-nitrogen hydrolase family protein n=1 Tax=Sulfitobacter sp. SK012 TaxID=1389005 RepID=UPI000E0C267C|nr:carbon-nitrogen hydrolase family protein [Sulfitobacter sp. SK012]AXI44653.1 amidohydrolase [Sulfitobacter sp. SK012]